LVTISGCSTGTLPVIVGGFYDLVDPRILGVGVSGSTECWTPRVVRVDGTLQGGGIPSVIGLSVSVWLRLLAVLPRRVSSVQRTFRGDIW